MTVTVFLTADPAMARPRDRAILRDNHDWAAQVVAHAASQPTAGIRRHLHVRGAYRRPADVRRAIVDGYRTAARQAGDAGQIVVLMGHGSDAMVDLGPAPHFRVDWDIVREANGMARQTSTGTTPGYGTEAESLLALSRAVGGRIAALRYVQHGAGHGAHVSRRARRSPADEREANPVRVGWFSLER